MSWLLGMVKEVGELRNIKHDDDADYFSSDDNEGKEDKEDKGDNEDKVDKKDKYYKVRGK